MRILLMIGMFVIGCQEGDVDSEVKLEGFAPKAKTYPVFVGVVKATTNAGTPAFFAVKIDYSKESREVSVLVAGKTENGYTCFTKFHKGNFPLKYSKENTAAKLKQGSFTVGGVFIAPSKEEMENHSGDNETNLLKFSAKIPDSDGRILNYRYDREKGQGRLAKDLSADKAFEEIELCEEKSPSASATKTQ